MATKTVAARPARRTSKSPVGNTDSHAVHASPVPGVDKVAPPKAATRSPRGKARGPGYTVEVRCSEAGQIQRLKLPLDDQSFYPFVQRWRYVVANRARITRASRESLSQDLTDWLSQVSGFDAQRLDTHIKALARARLVEVSIPYAREEVGWAARLFPWENALSLLTRPFRQEGLPFTVVRHLDVGRIRALPPVPASLLVVRSGPGQLASLYDLQRECDMVTQAFQSIVPESKSLLLQEPDRRELQACIVERSPAVVHLAGVDPYALETQGLQRADPENTDGFVLRQAERGYDAVPPLEMAVALNGSQTKPLLVAVSSCFSAQRLGALAVAQGAQHALGFFDTLTDADAMLFFGTFYRAWVRDWNVLDAFTTARTEWAAQSPAQSTGVVLWSRVSSVEPPTSAVRAKEALAAAPPPAPPQQVTVDALRLHVALRTDRAPAGQRAPTTSLNYSLLHNDRTPFSTFFIDKPLPGKLPPLQVEVALEVGGDFCRCRFSEDLPEGAGSIELAPRIRLPLVAGLLRQCTEALRTNLYVRVRCGERLLRETSERVTVLPADEWRDDGADHCWLPSFVLPRDPAVLKVIGAAQRYLRALLDDCSAGFDGYQQLLDDDSNAAAVVDPQVQAIWAALQHDLPVNYINPPPSYTSQSQRLRNPSEVFRGNAATCIDLALLFASCLEFVGIYPVVFLISGHAFPGYWRSDKAWWRMKQFRFEQSALPGSAAPGVAQRPTPAGQSEGWMFDGVGNLVELLRYVQDGTLVPFESTFVAAQRGFYAALEEGSARLHPDTFDSMIDVQSARAANVTPLPLFDKFA